jgi:hypothetical protein
MKIWQDSKLSFLPLPPAPPQENCSKFIISLNLGLNLTKITSKTSHSSRAFPEFPWKHLFLILLNSQWQNCSIFNKSYVVSVNIIEPHQCTPYLLTEGFSVVPRGRGGCTLLWEISTWQTNHLFLIDRCYYHSCSERTHYIKNVKYVNKNIECNILIVE